VRNNIKRSDGKENSWEKLHIFYLGEGAERERA
jgi:hypothetical protein